jgi:hypothetical protein
MDGACTSLPGPRPLYAGQPLDSALGLVIALHDRRPRPPIQRIVTSVSGRMPASA